jgi:hypothetical protein
LEGRSSEATISKSGRLMMEFGLIIFFLDTASASCGWFFSGDILEPSSYSVHASHEIAM